MGRSGGGGGKVGRFEGEFLTSDSRVGGPITDTERVYPGPAATGVGKLVKQSAVPNGSSSIPFGRRVPGSQTPIWLSRTGRRSGRIRDRPGTVRAGVPGGRRRSHLA